MKSSLAFVGVGRMGANMARRLQEQGWPVTAVYDLDRPGARKLAAELGARPCTELADVTARADIIFTVVTDDAAQRAVFAPAGDSLLDLPPWTGGLSVRVREGRLRLWV